MSKPQRKFDDLIVVTVPADKTPPQTTPMNKIRRLGFIECDGGIKINQSLLTVVLHE
jgi:hypothetical protein